MLSLLPFVELTPFVDPALLTGKADVEATGVPEEPSRGMYLGRSNPATLRTVVQRWSGTIAGMIVPFSASLVRLHLTDAA